MKYLHAFLFLVILFLFSCSSDGGSNSVDDTETVGIPCPSNTGYAGTLLPYAGPTTITTSGTTIEDFSLIGSLTIDADNVVLSNFSIDATNQFYGIKIESGHTGIVIEYGELFNMQSAAILGVGFTASYLNIHDSDGDGLKVQDTVSAGPTVVQYCYIHRLGKGLGAHADGNQSDTTSDVTFRYNNIDMPAEGTPNYPGAPYKSNAAFIFQDSATITNFVITDNWINGGNYTIYGHAGVVVRNNAFGRDYQFGVKTGSFDEWSNNVWADTEEIIP